MLDGDIASAVAELKSRPGRELQVHGSLGLVRTLHEYDLVDEYNLLTFPVVVGQGRRLFAERGLDTGMSLVETRSTSNGVIIAVYRRTGRAEFGTMEVE